LISYVNVCLCIEFAQDGAYVQGLAWLYHHVCWWAVWSGFTGCTSVCGDQVFSCCYHNFHSLYTAIPCDT
jgi:hypothetical protein